MPASARCASTARLPEVGARILAEQPEVQAQLARIDALWTEALSVSGGPFLFGAFSAADAMFAPVAQRVLTYGLPLTEVAQDYIGRLQASPGVARWVADALAEHDFLAFDEPYRSARDTP
jgi:glutathione S-transferase